MSQSSHTRRLMQLGLLAAGAALAPPTAAPFSCTTTGAADGGAICRYRPPSSARAQIVCDEKSGSCVDVDSGRASAHSFESIEKMARLLPDWRLDVDRRFDGVDDLLQSESGQKRNVVLGTERSAMSFLGLSGDRVVLETGAPEAMRERVQALQRIKLANGGVCHPNIECLLDFFVAPDDSGQLRPVVVTRYIAESADGAVSAFDVLKNWDMTSRERAELVLKIAKAYEFIQDAQVLPPVFSNKQTDNIAWNTETNEPVIKNIGTSVDRVSFSSPGLARYLRAALEEKLHNRRDPYDGVLNQLLHVSSSDAGTIVRTLQKALVPNDDDL